MTAVFHRIVNEHKRSDTRLSGRSRPLITVHDTTTNGRNTVGTKRAKYGRNLVINGRICLVYGHRNIEPGLR
jgi:hypothetical protein